MCTEETDELDPAEHCSSRKKPKMDVDYLPLYAPAVSLSAGTPISAILSSEESSNSSGLTTSSSADSSYLHSPSSPIDESSSSGDTIRPARVLQELNHESSASSAASHYHMQVRTIALPQPEPTIPAMPAVLKRFNDAEDIWKSMLKKEACYERSSSYLTKHRDLQYRMRSLLVDWLMEVCEEYKLKRSTLYLACEHIDRYMAKSRDVPKTRLQLIGVTALHIAGKNEEIYPPKLTTLVELTDGACTEREVVHQEMLMLHKLKWMLSPVTPVMWINFYVQVHDHYWSAHRDSSSNNVSQQESTLNSCISLHVKSDYKELMVKIARLLDICLYDIEHLDFRPSVLAATAFYHCMGLANTTVVSGYTQEDLSLCIKWMKPFANSYRSDACSKESIKFRGEDDYQVHTHATNLSNLDHAMEVRERLNRARFESPVNVGGVMTPPLSGHK